MLQNVHGMIVTGSREEFSKCGCFRLPEGSFHMIEFSISWYLKFAYLIGIFRPFSACVFLMCQIISIYRWIYQFLLEYWVDIWILMDLLLVQFMIIGSIYKYNTHRSTHKTNKQRSISIYYPNWNGFGRRETKIKIERKWMMTHNDRCSWHVDGWIIIMYYVLFDFYCSPIQSSYQ